MAGDGITAGRQRSRANGASAAGGGLRVERVWTTEGVHPYDEVEWERRDVVMTNWRDGSVNFEQRGVEFPKSWSVNAANIVTRSEEHTSELQSRHYLVCRLLLDKKNYNRRTYFHSAGPLTTR